jgi:RNA polymerase-interacting CarD/CdnL/TRCF family regulator
VDTLGELRLAVDDLVVYASHGVGRVAIRQSETVVLEFAEAGLSVTLPIERALECVRPVSTEVEIASLGRILGGADTVCQENWQRRLKTTRGKVTGGEAVGLAEVIRDASRRDERATAREELGRLSLTERQLYLKARKLLADEVGASRGVDPSAADAWIGDQLARNGDRGPSRETRASAKGAAPIETTCRPSGRRARRRRH